MPRIRRPVMAGVGAPFLVVALALAVGRVPVEASQAAPGVVPELRADQPVYEPSDTGTTIALHGDSVPDQFAQDFPQEQYQDLSVVSLAVPGCDIFDSALSYRENSQSPECVASKRNFGENLRSVGADVVLVMVPTLSAAPHDGPEGPLWLESPGFRDEMGHALDRLRGQADDAGVPMQVGTIPCRDPRQLASIPGIADYVADHHDVIEAVADPHDFNEWIIAWADERDVPVVDLYEALGCSSGPVHEIQGVTLYKDGLHFRPEAAAMIWTWMAPLVRDRVQGAER